jgi:CheY-like chemotaxis protein
MYKVNFTNSLDHCIESDHKLNILIVDDDENSRESLRYILNSYGHNITTLDEGMKCVNRCAHIKFDLIFMDYHINDLDGDIKGSDVTQMVKECFDTTVPIYAYTGDNSTDAINDMKKNDMKGVFIKPVDHNLIYNFLQINNKYKNNNLYLPRLARKNKNFMYFGNTD